MNQTKSLVSKLFALSALALSLAFVPIGHAILTSPIEETTYAWTGTQTPSVTDSYYSQASGLTGSALKSKLYTFNKPVSTSYDWGRYEAADEAYDNSNYVICLYTRHDIPKSAHVGGSYSWDLWNREHIYTQSAFPNSDKDNHNIFACEGQINNYRGNLKFGEVTHNSANQLTVFGHLTNNYKAGSYFEPCDEAKGEVARAVLYTSLYYNYTISSIFSSEAVCLKWHAQFPVTEREIFRNNKVYVNQGNRNPFVDHPSYANSIYNPSTPYTEADPLGGGTPVTAPNTITVTPSSSSIAVGGNVTLTANVDSGSSSVTWSSSNGNIATVSNGVVTGVAAGTVTITATSTINTSIKGTASINVKSLSSLTFTGTPTTTAYYAGQSFNPSGLTITAHFSDGSTSNVTLQCSFSPNPLTLGATSVIASYTFGGITKTATISGITVVNRVVSSISVLNNPTKMSYTIGQSFDPTGMIIRATYNIGANSDNYTAYTYSPSAAFTTLGNKTITITSNENTNLSTSIVVNVVESIIEEGTYSITSGATTYTKPMDPTMLVINKSNSESPDITFSDISDNVRLFGSPITGSIMIGNGSTSGGSFKMTLDSGLYVSKIEFVGNDKDTGAAGTATLSVNNASVNFSDITAEDSVILKPYSNSITITTTARIWTHEIKITALSAQSCALEFGQYFLDTTAAQCASKNVTSATWNTIQSFYNGLNVDIQNAIKASASNQNGNAMEHAMARYDDIISKYGLTDFLGTGNPSKGLNGMSNSSNYMLVFISVIGMFTAIGCTLYLVKKKKEKLS